VDIHIFFIVIARGGVNRVQRQKGRLAGGLARRVGIPHSATGKPAG
jgi:hypothetical protein